jgi:two-component system nitrogen regulation response regulator GlnG
MPNDLPALIASAAQAGVEAKNAAASQAAPVAADSKATNLSAVSKTLFRWAKEQGSLKILPSVERELIIQALLETKGNQVQAAKLLGITRATLRKRVEKFHIKQALAIQ